MLKEPVPSRLYLGEEKPVIQGWWSEKERKIVPNYAFNYELTDVCQGMFATLFNFSEQLQTNFKWTKVNESGRKGKFRWQDETGVHDLSFKRTVSGKMSVNYALIK
jgi:hypothetical protein